MDFTTPAVTASIMLPDSDPELVVITVEPTARVLARPEFALTVALTGVPEVQMTAPVKLAVLLSENVPIAVNCCVSPTGTLGELGAIAMESKPLTKDTLARCFEPDTK